LSPMDKTEKSGATCWGTVCRGLTRDVAAKGEGKPATAQKKEGQKSLCFEQGRKLSGKEGRGGARFVVRKGGGDGEER